MHFFHSICFLFYADINNIALNNFVPVILYFEFSFWYRFKHGSNVIKHFSLIDKPTQYIEFSKLPKGDESNFKRHTCW